MPISVNPATPAIAPVQGTTAPGLVLREGTTVNAQVLNVLASDLVRIAIAGLTVDVLSEVPLQAGQNLQLAVSQTENGIRLAVVGADSGAPSVLTDSVTLAPDAPVAASPSVNAVAPGNQLTPLERVAVLVAAETAATQQGSQAPLFANLGAAAASNSLPPALQQAVLQVLAQQTSLDQNLTGSDIQNAFQKSGLFLEASLASGIVSPLSGIPDLKAALIVLRQTLASSLSATESPALAAAPQPAAQTAAGSPAGEASSAQNATEAPALAPAQSPEIAAHEILPPQARLPLADDASGAAGAARIVLSEALLNTGIRTLTTSAALNLLQEALQQASQIPGNASSATVTLQNGRSEDVTVHTNAPPPLPFRGALPSAQPIAQPSIAPNASLAATVHRLLDDTDAAIARQTLLQVASLPDRIEGAGGRIDPSVPRWNFEIPFATAQGTAMAQFEISRDGGGSEVEAAKPTWRARFSIDVEPSGPIHALVSLSGEKTSVRMWAERPATAAQLRAGAGELSQALSRAELQPGDIVIRDGTPPQSHPARAGHFLDRAL